MFSNIYQDFIYKRTYARWDDERQRREDWDETVGRYRDCLLKVVPKSKQHEFRKACEALEHLEIMGSMRALWTAGPALERENVAAYNCAYVAVDKPRVFAEILYILMNGTGVGFSVERQYINKLPQVPESIAESDVAIMVADSKKGWAQAYLELVKSLYEGKIPTWDMSKVRPAGARLKTFGGRASGPGPLDSLFKFTVARFKEAKGRQLTSVDVHRICCKIAEVVVVGGVRRSACISLSNPSDDRMRNLKSGQFWETMPELGLSNNSAAWTEKPDADRFLTEWLALIRSRSGERGIFNRKSAQYVASLNGRRDASHDFGCNPCSEIILRSKSFCNLTEVIIRSTDDLEDLKRKVRLATILGVVQSTLTKFDFLSREWKKNSEEERLLGVSLTGLRDHPVLSRTGNEAKLWLTAMKQAAVDTAIEWAKALEINVPAAITCVKPSGTVSQLVDSSSGLHPRYAPYYIRRVRVARMDPLCQLLVDAGMPHQPEVGQSLETASTLVFEFPIKSPDTSVCADETSAMEQLEYWLMLQQYWCEHKPSCTIYVSDPEWPEVGAWVYKNWNWISGISFLPKDDCVYELAPYEEITESRYDELVKALPILDFVGLDRYEREDATSGSRAMACSAGGCELS